MTVDARPISLDVVRRGGFDGAAVAALVNDAYRRHTFLEADRTSPEELLVELGEGELILATGGDEPMGCVMLRNSHGLEGLEGTLPDYRNAWTLYLGMAAVARKAQGTGIGGKLLAAAEAHAIRGHYRRILLGALAEMGNTDYYARFGYHTLAADPFPANHWGITIPHTHHVMVKDLPTGIRFAELNEAAEIARLVNLAYRVEDFFIDGNRTSETEIAGLLDEHAFLVADAPAGGLAGSVFVSREGNRGYFGMLSVAPDHQRSGLGAALIEAAEQHCRERGCDVMDLTVVNLREELPAYYAKFGYAVSGTEPWPDADIKKLKMPAHFMVMTKLLDRRSAGHGR